MLTKLLALRMKDTTVLITIQQDDLTVARAQHVTLKSRRRHRRYRLSIHILTRWFGRFIGMAWHSCLVDWCRMVCCFALARAFATTIMLDTRDYSTPNGNGINLFISRVVSTSLVGCVRVSARLYAFEALKATKKFKERARSKHRTIH